MLLASCTKAGLPRPTLSTQLAPIALRHEVPCTTGAFHGRNPCKCETPLARYFRNSSIGEDMAQRLFV